MRASLAVLVLPAAGTSACCEADAASAAAGGAQVTVLLADLRFSPAVIEVPSGETFTLEVRNVGKIDHDLTIDAIRFKVVVDPADPVSCIENERPASRLKAGLRCF